MKKVGVLGSGPVGKVLAAGFVKYGFDVQVGTRDQTKLKEWLKQNPSGKVGSFDETIKHGDIIVLAVGGKVAKEVLHSAQNNISGKIVIDATNPISDAPPSNGMIQYFTDSNFSLMEELQAEFSSAHFVKAFNSVGNAFMVDPDFKEGKPTMFICGNNDSSKKEVEAILDKFGWETEDMGTAEAARVIEPLAILWCLPGFLRNQWNHAFKLLKK